VSRLLLDTTFLIDADRGGASLDEVIAGDDEVAIAAVTVAQLLVGVLLADDHKRTVSLHRASQCPARAP
jgi:tRNA(fMet)-specific endonuclease VapC